MTSTDALMAAQVLAGSAPQRAQVQNIGLGTAGWTDPSLIRCRRFYPRGVRSASERLSHYAAQFPFVEVDATYYTLLPPERATRWLETTPPEFRFHIKAHASLTGHPVDLARLPASLRGGVAASSEKPGVYPDALPPGLLARMYDAFAEFLTPISAKERLSSVLLQFPPWFAATRGNARKIDALAERFAAFPLSIEFRNASWFHETRRQRVLSWLSERKLGYVMVDDLPGGVWREGRSVVCIPRQELAIFRFHGQNQARLRRGASVAERYDYLFSEEELKAWVAPIRQAAQSATQVDVVFNNCVEDYAILNAKGLSRLLLEVKELGD